MNENINLFPPHMNVAKLQNQQLFFALALLKVHNCQLPSAMVQRGTVSATDLLEKILTQTEEAIKGFETRKEGLTVKNVHLLGENDWLHSSREGLLAMCFNLEEKEKKAKGKSAI
jgi:hypothetical protein